MDFKEYDDFIKNHKFDMLYFIIYYNLKCNELSENIEEEDLEYIITFIYNSYLKDEEHIDLGYICDKALECKEEILYNKNSEYLHFSYYDLLEKCV